jgi:hypothetical protein
MSLRENPKTESCSGPALPQANSGCKILPFVPLTLEQRRCEEIQHLSWRVGFCQTLLDMHRNLPQRNPEWFVKETDLMLALKEANEDLRRAERAAGVVRLCEEAC